MSCLVFWVMLPTFPTLPWWWWASATPSLQLLSGLCQPSLYLRTSWEQLMECEHLHSWKRLTLLSCTVYNAHKWRRRLSVTNLSLENNLPTFQLNAPVVIRAKVKKCEQTLVFIAVPGTRHWRSKADLEPSAMAVSMATLAGTHVS